MRAVFLTLLSFAEAFTPNWPPTFQLNLSTAAMPCNYTGLSPPSSLSGWNLQDFDWSNALALWSADVPMDTEERLMQQVALTKASDPQKKVFIYRNSIYGYPWYTEVRKILDDPAYSPWFIKFKPVGPWYSPKCDSFHTPPLCTEFFHTQMDTPRPDGKGYGQCAKPACNCGTKPCGFYVFNHSSDVVINNQTFPEWFIDSYFFNSAGMSPSVSGFFADDFWSLTGNMGDNTPNATEDMGLTPADLQQLTASYTSTMDALKARILKEGKFLWQMFWTGGDADAKGSTCPSPIVRGDAQGCKEDLAALCTPNSPPQTNAMMYAFSPGGCRTNPANLTNAANDIANFLLIRGPYAWIGHGWLSCSRTYQFPAELNDDHGEPLGLCAETAPDSGIFQRQWSKSTVTMNCNTQTSSIVFKD